MHAKLLSCLAVLALWLAAPHTRAEVSMESYKTHESKDLQALAAKVGKGEVSRCDLMRAEEAWLLGKLAERRVPLSEGASVPELTSLLHQLRDNLRCQLYMAEKMQANGAITEAKVQSIRDKMAEAKAGSRPADYENFDVYVDALEAQQDSKLVQELLKCLREYGVMDWLEVLEVDEARLRIAIAGVRDFNVSAEGKPLMEKLRENLEEQLRLEELRCSHAVAPFYECLLVREKLERWFKPSVVDSYMEHACPEVRLLAGKIQQGTASWADLLRAEERWLLGKITDAARSKRRLTPEEASLVEKLRADAAAPQAQAWRMCLIWFPVPQGAEDLEARLRQNLRCRLTLAEQQMQAGVGSQELVDQLRGKLALCPVLQGERDDSPADAAALSAYAADLEQSDIPMVRYAEKRYRDAAISFLDVLQTEATALHIRIMARAVLPYVPAGEVDYLAMLENNLLCQLRLARNCTEAGVDSEAVVAELREKLSTWFSK